MSHNPFRGSVQGDAWGEESGLHDVAGIHHGTFLKCCQAVDAVREGPCSAGIVIHGEPGSGKTHLIGRLRRQFTDRFCEPTLERISQAFAYVRLNTNESSLARHVRRCVAGDLLRTFGKGPSQLERLALTQLMNVAEGQGDLAHWWDFFLDERAAEIDDLLTTLGLNERLSPTFVKILGHVVRRQHRLEVAGWLRGDALSTADYEKLGVPELDAESDPEAFARETLIDMMRLAGPKIPLVLCFDQVEALQVTPADTLPFFTYAKLIADLYDADTNLVLISCMQTAIAQSILPAIPEYAKPRLQGYAVCILKPLDANQARDLLAARVKPAGKFATTDLSPLTETDLKKFLGPLNHVYPRELLDRAARRFDQLTGSVVPEKSLEDWLVEEWDRRTEQAVQTSSPDLTEAILGHGIPLLVNVVDSGWTSSQGKQGVALDHVLTGERQEARVGVKILTGTDSRRLWNPLKTLNNLYPDKLQPKLQKLVILRDERTPIRPTAVKAREYLDSLEKKHALYFRVPPEALAALDALRALLGDSQSGDLDLDGQAIGPETVRDWLRAHLPGSLKELADVLVTPAEPEPASTLIDRLQEQLTEQRVASAEALASGLGVRVHDLVDAARSRPDLFGVIDGPATAVFSSRVGSRCLDPQVVVES